MKGHLIRNALLIVLSPLCLMPASVSRAASTYDPGTNTITLGVGMNTLGSIYDDISDPAVIGYNSGTNTYTLNAHISGQNGVNADLTMADSTLRLNDGILVKTWSDLAIDNMTLQAINPAQPWKMHAYARYTSYSASITDSDVSGGQILIAPNGYQTPSTPTTITNNTFHDFTSKPDPIGDSNYMLSLQLCAPVNAYLYNNSFENVHLNSEGTSYEGIVKLHGYTGLVMDQTTFTNCTVPNLHNHYGIVYFYGTAGTTPCPVVSNVTLTDCEGMGLSGKEYGNVVYKDVEINDVTRQAIFLYHTDIYDNTSFWISNATIDGADIGIAANARSDTTVDIYNVKINNVRVAYDTSYYGRNEFFITNSTESNYTTLHNVPSNAAGGIRRYELLDVCVMDDYGAPVSGATVTITVENPGGATLCSINRLLEELIETQTLANGHTPLPVENEADTIALLRLLKTDAFEQSGFTYTISVSKGAMNDEVTGVTPTDAWYRLDPDTYENTILLTLTRIAGDANVNGEVNGNDMSILLANWGTGTTWEEGDFDGDNDVNGNDLSLLLSNWNVGVSGAGEPVPEPATLALLMLGGLAATRRTQGRHRRNSS